MVIMITDIIITSLSLSNHRHNNIIIRSAARGMPVLPVFDAMMPRGDAHNFQDCTHYSFDSQIW